MIVAKGLSEDGKTQCMILGLSSLNIMRLMNNQPMEISREKHGEAIPEGWKIVLLFGQTEQSLFAEMRKAGIIRPDTNVHIDPRLKGE
jgi:hypothetical protein